MQRPEPGEGVRMMFSYRLVRLIESHADALAAGLEERVQASLQVTHFRDISAHELRERVYEIYRHLGEWLLGKNELDIEQRYREIGSRRARQKVSAQRSRPGHCPDQGKSLGVPEERGRAGPRRRNHGRTGTAANARDVLSTGRFIMPLWGMKRNRPERHAEKTRYGPARGADTMSMSWEMEYKKRLRTADEALHCVKSGMRVYIQPGCAEPETLVEALMRRAPYVYDVEIVHLMTMGCAPYVAPEMAGHFRHNAVFIGANVRDAINDGRADYTPIYLSEIEGLFESGEMPIDVALIEVSPPDSHGFCSFGVGVDTTLTAAKCARHVVAQVNEQMPRTYGDSFIHVSEIDAFVESLAAVVRAEDASRQPTCQIAIARNVAGLIEDGVGLADRHRRNSRRRPAAADGPQGPWRAQRTGLRRRDSADRSRSHHRRAQELQAAQDHPRLRSGHRSACSTLSTTIPSFEFHPTAYTNDPVLHRAQRQHGGDQLRDCRST